MPRNRPVGALGIFGEGDVPDFENDHSTCRCTFCGRNFDTLGGVHIFLQVYVDVKYARRNPRLKDRPRRAGTGGPICFKCLNGGPQRIAARCEKRAAKLKRPDLKEEDLFAAALFRRFPDFTGFKGYKLAKVIADAQ